MKIFAIVLVSLFALSKADSGNQKIDGKLISPDFLFDLIYEYQDELDRLQDEINLAIKDVQAGMSSVLSESTDRTLGQYNTHVTSLHGAHGVTAALFNNVVAGQCRDDSLSTLADLLRLSGNRKSNCARTYDSRVQSRIDEANASLKSIDDVYSLVQSIAVKSFIAANAFLDPEDIQYTILDMTELVRGKWEAVKPNLETIRANLRTRIQTHNNELGTCLTNNANTTQMLFNSIADMVTECNDFNSKKSKSRGNFADRLREIMTAAENAPEFEWSQI